MTAAVAEVLAHRHAGVRRDELKRRRFRRRRRDDDGVLHRAVLLQPVNDLGHRRALLSDRHVDADDVSTLLVDDRVDRDCGLAGLPISDDELALAAADRDHRIDGLYAGLHRLLDRCARDDAGCLDLDAAAMRCLDLAETVDRLPERIDHAAEQSLADRHVGNTSRTANFSALADLVGIREDGGADVVFLEVENHPLDSAFEFQQLTGGRTLEAMNARNTVAGRKDATGLAYLDLPTEVTDLLFDEIADLGSLDLLHRIPPDSLRCFGSRRLTHGFQQPAQPAMRRSSSASCVRTLPS